MTARPDSPQPIATRYAGCRFRSRLEARWAVFFDHLPDFLLTDCGTWVEVKGSDERLDAGFLRTAALELPRVACRGERGPRLLILGPIPDQVDPEVDLGWLGLGPAEPEVRVDRWGFGSYRKNNRPWWLADIGGVSESPDPWLVPLVVAEPGCPDAYRAARAARFEHHATDGTALR